MRAEKYIMLSVAELEGMLKKMKENASENTYLMPEAKFSLKWAGEYRTWRIDRNKEAYHFGQGKYFRL